MASAPVSRLAPNDLTLDFLVQQSKQEDKAIVLRRLQRFMVEGTQAPIRQQYEIEASLQYSYVENDFYTADELAVFKQRGQPPTKRNEIAPIIERIIGQFIQTRQVPTFLGRNTPADDEVAALAQDYQRWNDQQNGYQFLEQDLAWDGLVGGVGWLKASVKYNELGQKDIIWRVVNPFHVYRDPLSTNYDPNIDAKFIMEGSWMDLEDAIALFPDKEDELLTYIGGGSGVWTPFSGNVRPSLENERLLAGAIYSISIHTEGSRKRVRPFEIWYKRKIKVYYLFDDNGVVALPIPLDNKTAHQLVKQAGEQLHVESVYQERMYTGVILGGLLIHHDISEHETNLFPYVPFHSGIRKNGCPLAHAARLVPINELVNKIESKAVSLISNRQTIAEKNAVEDIEEFQKEKARPDGYMQVREGALSGQKIINTNNLDIGQGNLALLEAQLTAMMRVSNMPDESMGRPGEVRSGTGIARKQAMGFLATTPVSNNLSRTRHLKAKLQYALMKQYLTEEQSFQITDDPNVPRLVKVTKSAIQALKERIYDIVIDEVKDYAVLREQQAEMLLTVLPQLAQFGPGMVALAIQLTEIRNKEGFIKMIQQQSMPGPVQPKVSLNMDWKELTPEEKAFQAMSTFKSQELAQAILQDGVDPAYLTKLKADLANTMVREGTRASIEHGRVDFNAMQTAVAGRQQVLKMLNDHAMNQQTLQAQQAMQAQQAQGDDTV